MNSQLQSELYKEFLSQSKYTNFMHFLISKIEPMDFNKEESERHYKALEKESKLKGTKRFK